MTDHDWEQIATDITHLIEDDAEMIGRIKDLLDNAGVQIGDDIPAFGLLYDTDVQACLGDPGVRKTIVKFGVTKICPRPPG